MSNNIKNDIKDLYGCKNVYGPYIGKDGRKRCVLYYGKGNTPSKSYPRLVLETKLGRKLTEDEEVDHIDTDHTNDDPINLQILGTEEHREKSKLETYVLQSNKELLTCPQCGTLFSATQTRINSSETPCCTRSCSSKYNGANQHGKFGTKYQV